MPGSGRLLQGWTPASAIRLTFGFTTALGLVLGYLGIAETRHLPLGLSSHTSDIIYWDLQFLTLDSDSLQGADSISWKLQVARFVIPMATFYAIAEAARHIFSGQWRRRTIRRLQGHVLVCGNGMSAALLTQRLLASGETVVGIGSGSDGHPERRHFQLAGDPQSPETLRAAAVKRAKTVYAFAEDTAANLGTALTAEAVPRPRSRQLTSYVHVEEPELCQALRARRLVMASDSGARVDFVNSSELAARVLVDGRPPGQAIEHLMIVGLGPFGRSLLLELTRQQRVLTFGRRARLTVVDDRAASIMDDLVARYPFLHHWNRTAIECPPAEFHLAGWSSRLPEGMTPDQTYLCGADPVSALRGALTAVRLWHGRPQSLVVCLENSLTYGDVFHTEAEALLDGLGGVLHIFGVLEAACRSEFDGQEMIEQLARSIHELYVASVLAAGSARAGSEVMVPWHVLPETYRHSSRAQAAHVGFKLREIGCMTAPTESGANHFAFADNEVEHLARLEHQRWLDERDITGWSYGPVRDDTAKIHPNMVPWSELTEDDRRKDREFVLALPDLLADVGLRIVRTGDQRALRPVR